MDDDGQKKALKEMTFHMCRTRDEWSAACGEMFLHPGNDQLELYGGDSDNHELVVDFFARRGCTVDLSSLMAEVDKLAASEFATVVLDGRIQVYFFLL
jgi:hypothetical protein